MAAPLVLAAATLWTDGHTDGRTTSRAPPVNKQTSWQTNRRISLRELLFVRSCKQTHSSITRGHSYVILYYSLLKGKTLFVHAIYWRSCFKELIFVVRSILRGLKAIICIVHIEWTSVNDNELKSLEMQYNRYYNGEYWKLLKHLDGN